MTSPARRSYRPAPQTHCVLFSGFTCMPASHCWQRVPCPLLLSTTFSSPAHLWQVPVSETLSTTQGTQPLRRGAVGDGLTRAGAVEQRAGAVEATTHVWFSLTPYPGPQGWHAKPSCAVTEGSRPRPALLLPAGEARRQARRCAALHRRRPAPAPGSAAHAPRSTCPASTACTTASRSRSCSLRPRTGRRTSW